MKGIPHEFVTTPDVSLDSGNYNSYKATEYNGNSSGTYEQFPDKVAQDLNTLFHRFENLTNTYFPALEKAISTIENNFTRIDSRLDDLEHKMDALTTSKEDIAIGITDAKESIRDMYTEFARIKESVIK